MNFHFLANYSLVDISMHREEIVTKLYLVFLERLRSTAFKFVNSSFRSHGEI